ncbi:unnamed protein product [Victoria cruziana]
MQESIPIPACFIGDKTSDDPSGLKSGQSAVMSVYQAMIAGMSRYVTIIWCKNLMAHSLWILIDTGGNEQQYTCKVDLKPWHFWSKKGFKNFEVAGNKLEVFWDLRTAKFSGGPEPHGEFYVAITCDDEVVLLLGELKKEAYRKTGSRPSLVDALLLSKKENVYGKRCFVTKAKFEDRGKEHDIVIESSISVAKDPEIWISIDGIVLVHVKALSWKFRGNDTVLVDRLPVQILWDVHDWIFSPGSGHALFVFQPGSPPENTGSETSFSSSSGSIHGYCLILYAWKME